MGVRLLSCSTLLLVFAASCSSKKTSAFEQQEAKCIQDCSAAKPAGKPLYQAFDGCLRQACGHLDPESEEADECMSAAFDPSNPTAACKAETQACFSGPIAGCKELLAYTEERCEPEQLPVTDELGFLTMTWCIIESGFHATPAVQEMAWPMLWCVMAEGPDGCGEACGQGRAACRECAAEKCGEVYAACEAHSAPFVEPVLADDKQGCQDIHTCVNFCLL